MAYPIINSPTFPSTADIPSLPPKLDQMPIFNPGTHTYVCEDGVTRVLTEEQAINFGASGISCKVVDRELNGAADLGSPQEFAPGPFFSGPRYRGVTMGDRRVVRRI